MLFPEYAGGPAVPVTDLFHPETLPDENEISLDIFENTVAECLKTMVY